MRSVMDCMAKGLLKTILVDRVFGAPHVLDSLRYMQQGTHLGEIVLEIRHESSGQFRLDDSAMEIPRTPEVAFDKDVSYLLVGGLGGLGRAMSVWMVQRGARHLTFLSRSAGSGEDDANFVRELESMSCTVQLVMVDVTKSEHVARAVHAVPTPLKGVVQISMVLWDQMFDRMPIEDWKTVTQPKVQGTWNLQATCTAIDLGTVKDVGYLSQKSNS
ncbi:uncharacterized protein PgNI_02547 [Pyricularia grisea]|uniref:Ketoreductase domain-containing protein n=1 Tax=Pyricularia grisea TaxID=148305 RepID=A0A6P8BJ56_PYRGI|nr:uncharacterized protein PgNI_02547 [Pyricularia grisea]TLD16699.1 hypothetical protein PgNI_02547 [Pyricularia grisea]